MSGPVNTRTAGVVDPILSTHARGYKNAAFIHNVLFPRVPILTRSGNVIKFGKDDFRRAQTRRAAGSDIVLRRHGDPQGAERAIAFDAHRKKLEALLAGWEPSEDHDCCDLVGAEVTGLGNGVSIYAQTWQTSRILTGE